MLVPIADRCSLILRLNSMFTFSLSDISQEFKHFGRDSIESVWQAIDCLLHECPWGVCRSRVLQSKHKQRHIHSVQDTCCLVEDCCGHTRRPHSGWSSRPSLPERQHAAAAGSPIVPDHWLFPRGMSSNRWHPVAHQLQTVYSRKWHLNWRWMP